MSDSALEVEGIRFRHPGAARDALQGVTLRLDRGEIAGVVGPNAAGKSTLARIAAGLVAPSAGVVRLGGTDVRALSRRERALRVAFLAQDEPGDVPFTAREIALMGRAPHLGLWALEGEADREKAQAALEELDAAQLADRPASQLSGGERKRVYLARTFAQGAPVLVLDEPTDALDLRHQARLVEALRARARQGGSALLVMHDLSLAAAACDRVVLLREGSVAAAGTPAEVLRAEVLENVYGTGLDVFPHPRTGRPLVAVRITPGTA
ncbi:MAG: ABC transporter ATP-binding protein [Myxococcales bacterium]